jgi:hypothetical protein
MQNAALKLKAKPTSHFSDYQNIGLCLLSVQHLAESHTVKFLWGTILSTQWCWPQVISLHSWITHLYVDLFHEIVNVVPLRSIFNFYIAPYTQLEIIHKRPYLQTLFLLLYGTYQAVISYKKIIW